MTSGILTYAYNPSYHRNGDQKDYGGLRQARKKVRDPHLN
jgi:hypothetical protein